MSTDFSLEEVLHFMEQEEIGGEFMDDYTPGADILKEESKEVIPPSDKSPEIIEDDDIIESSEEEEDDIVEKDEKVDEIDDDGDAEDNDSNTVPKSYFDILNKYEVLDLPEDFEFDGSAEKLKEALDTTKERRDIAALQTLWERLDPEFQAALKYNLDGGKDFSKFVSVYGKQEDFTGADLTDLDTQKAIVREYYKQTSKYSPDKINRLINRLIETEDLADEAEEAIDYLKQKREEEQAALLASQEKERAEKQAAAEAWRSTIADTIKESEIPKTRRTKVQAYVLNPVQRDNTVMTDFERTLTAIFSNPEHYIQLADLVYDYDPKKGLNTGRIQTKSKTQAASDFQKELEEAMKNTGKQTSGTQPKKGGKEAVLDWENILKQLDK